MSISRCEYCDEMVDTDFNLEHWADSEFEVCMKQIDNLEQIEYANKTFYFQEDKSGVYLELIEVEEGEFDSIEGHSNEFLEAIEYRNEERKLDHKFPER